MLDVLFVDEIGQFSEELLSEIDVMLQRIRDIQVVCSSILLISTIDHTQLQPVKLTPFLLSSLIIACFTMVKLDTSQMHRP